MKLDNQDAARCLRFLPKALKYGGHPDAVEVVKTWFNFDNIRKSTNAL